MLAEPQSLFVLSADVTQASSVSTIEVFNCEVFFFLSRVYFPSQGETSVQFGVSLLGINQQSQTLTLIADTKARKIPSRSDSFTTLQQFHLKETTLALPLLPS